MGSLGNIRGKINDRYELEINSNIMEGGEQIYSR